MEPDEVKRLELIHNEAFDPRETMVLEVAPEYGPTGETIDGAVRVIDESTDAVTLEVDVNADAVLLMGDAYAKSWKIDNLGEAAQQRYTLMPANHALRAIPLAKGHHRIRLSYGPLSYAIGFWVTLVSAPAFFLVSLASLSWHVRHS